jgi:2-polyprenyl-3-methyl-5-hydroxy-6-metoxy-1,4-benzoquinol methylase
VFSSYQADPHFDGFWGDEVQDEPHAYWRRARDGMYRDFARKYLHGRSGRLLDMGCGLGFFLKRVDEAGGWEGVGCEVSAAAVRFALEKLHLKDVVCSRLERAPLPDNSFDIITMWDVIDHIPRPDALLVRCHSLLRGGGFCFLRTPNVRVQLARSRVKQLVKGVRPGLKYLQAQDHLHHYSPASITRLLQRNGFTDVEFVHLRPVMPPDNSPQRLLFRRLCFSGVRTLALVTAGRLNLDTLFVLARKAR